MVHSMKLWTSREFLSRAVGAVLGAVAADQQEHTKKITDDHRLMTWPS